MGDIVLSLKRVGRAFPRSTSNIPVAIFREMLLPRSKIGVIPDDYFYALKDINLNLEKGQNVGVVGTHLSGKTILASLASGLLDPTVGAVVAAGSRLLISRPTAGFKPALTVSENLEFRAALMGLSGEKLHEALDQTYSSCGFSHEKAKQQIGNFSPYLIKELAFSLLLTLETDILIVDELVSAGSADSRRKTRSLLAEKIDMCSSLVVSSDISYLSEICEKCFLLDAGMLSGPYETEEAAERFQRVAEGSRRPRESRTQISGGQKNTDSQTLDFIGSKKQTAHFHNIQEERQDTSGESLNRTSEPERARAKKLSSLQTEFQQASTSLNDDKAPKLIVGKVSKPQLFSIASLQVDESEYTYRRLSLLRKCGDELDINLSLLANSEKSIEGGLLEIFDGVSKAVVGQVALAKFPKKIISGESYSVKFRFVIPSEVQGFLGIALTPISENGKLAAKSRLKLLIVGLAGRGKRDVPHLKLHLTEL